MKKTASLIIGFMATLLITGSTFASLVVSNGTFDSAPANIGDFDTIPAIDSGEWYMASKGNNGLEYNSASNWIESNEGQRRTIVQFIDIEAGTDSGAYTLKLDWMHEVTPANVGRLDYAVYTSSSNNPVATDWDLNNGNLAASYQDWTQVATDGVSTNASTSWATAALNFNVAASDQWVAIAIMADNSSDGSGMLSIDNVNVVPEPATFGLMAAIGGGILFIRRRLAFS